ncbi:uncharacterized protein [Macrobrachium rosenbergii]|uniref:uncharacterized protein n=1 Tax=Macrobrachium rosenbergii TaxID=79674 RepID=UPI0034D51A46
MDATTNPKKTLKCSRGCPGHPIRTDTSLDFSTFRCSSDFCVDDHPLKTTVDDRERGCDTNQDDSPVPESTSDESTPHLPPQMNNCQVCRGLPTRLRLPSQLYPPHAPLMLHPFLCPGGLPLTQTSGKFSIQTLGERLCKMGAYITSGAFAKVFRCQVKVVTEDGVRRWVDAVAKCNLILNPREAVALTERELQVLSRLKGLPGVPKLYGRIKKPRPGIVMSIAGRTTLSRAIILNELTAAEFVGIMISVGEIVQGIHRRGIGHYDLHGSNVMLDDGNRPTVIDFGFSGDYASGHDNLAFLHLLRTGLQKFGDQLLSKNEALGALVNLICDAIVRKSEIPRLQTVIDKLEKLREEKELASIKNSPRVNNWFSC